MVESGIRGSERKDPPTALHRVATRLFRHVPPDPVTYWGVLAQKPGTQSVMWMNPTYNASVDAD